MSETLAESVLEIFGKAKTDKGFKLRVDRIVKVIKSLKKNYGTKGTGESGSKYVIDALNTNGFEDIGYYTAYGDAITKAMKATKDFKHSEIMNVIFTLRNEQ